MKTKKNWKKRKSADIKKEFDSKPVFDKKYSKTKIKSYDDEVTYFCDKKFLSNKFVNDTCLAVFSLDSALKKNDNYYPQVFLKECKYIEKKSMIIWVIFLIFLMRLMKNSYQIRTKQFWKCIFLRAQFKESTEG